MSDRLKVTAAVIIEDGKVLITQRHTDDAMGGKWEFPGGKIEADETPECCLQRELREELDLITDIHELLTVSRHAYPAFDIELLAYRATIHSGQISLNAHRDYRWATLQELETVDFSEADIPIMKYVLNKMSK